MTQPTGRMLWIVAALCASLSAQADGWNGGSEAAAERPQGEIRGKITITGKGEGQEKPLSAMLFERYPSHGEGMAISSGTYRDASPAKLSERAVVYLESAELNHGKYSPPEKNPVLDQKNLQFHPMVLPILVGTTVDFPNRDNLFHNVFSYSSPKEFDLGRYPRDDSRSVTFDRPGVVRVYCDIHSQMSATILVLPHPYFASPDDSGSFAIGNVPDGKYTLVLWYDRDVVKRQSIVIEGGKPVEADFTY